MNAAPWPAGVSAASPSSTLGADEPVTHIAWAGLCLQTSTDTRAHAACNARYAAHDAPVNEPGAQVLLCILVPVHVHAAAAVAARARGEAYGAFPPHDAVPHRTGERSRVQSRACFRMREMYARRAAPAAGRDNDLVAQPHAHPQAHGRHHSAGNQPPSAPPVTPPCRGRGAALGTQCARTHRDAHTPSHAHTRTALARSGRLGDTGCAVDFGQVGSGRDGAMGSPRRIVRPDLLSGAPGRVAGLVRVPRCCAASARPPTLPPVTITNHKRATLAGLVEFLISDDPLACALRARLIFKVPSRRLTSPPFLVSCGFGHDARPPAHAA
jgi:hypothetical protein